MTMLKAREISVRYDGREALAGVSLSLREEEIVALLGANGAGKSTLIRALNGAVPLASGEVLLGGRSSKDLSRREIARWTAVVAQENETRFPVTVTDFVLSGRFVHGGAFGWETPQDVQTAERAINDCDLGGLAGRQMNHLSGGERQRVVLARALATGAPILLLDEPTANLDLAHQALMFRLVRERCRKAGSAAVVITHDLNLASEFADEIILLKGGTAVAAGPPNEVLTAENIRNVYGVDVLLDDNPVSGKVRVTALY
jgi:iron complex transport system ATP-binding protein